MRSIDVNRYLDDWIVTEDRQFVFAVSLFVVVVGFVSLCQHVRGDWPVDDREGGEYRRIG